MRIRRSIIVAAGTLTYDVVIRRMQESFNRESYTCRNMALVRLGKMHLRWCQECNVPVLEEEVCGRCGGRTEAVNMTPPGDARPGFEYNLDLVRDLLDQQFGPGSGEALLPHDQVFVMSKVPGLDRLDEIISNGAVVATLRYDLGIGWRVLPRVKGAAHILKKASKNLVVADIGAVEPILGSQNLMAPGVGKVIGDFSKGEEVIVLDPEQRALATGVARMTSDEMRSAERGVAVKVRWSERPADPEPRNTADWQKALEANANVMRRRVYDGRDFVLRMVEQYKEIPQVVSFSGGKDSLACLLLTREAGLDLPIFFIDTGLEFPETVEYVHQLKQELGLNLVIGKADDEAFFGNLEFFGPPGKDYRWCCKTNKLGPTVKAIVEHYPDGVLSFIGQRRYESEQRANKPRVWHNPWTPGQIGASPIQDWTSLHVWLYIFQSGVSYNPWYERGLDRIGCFLCPASDMAELSLVHSSPSFERWEGFLKSYAERKGLGPEWVEHGLWRWKKVPPSVIEELKRNIPGFEITRKEGPRTGEGNLRLRMQEGFSPCTLGFSIEGAFSRDLDLEQVSSVLNMVGVVDSGANEGWCAVGNVTVFREGAVIAKGADQEKIRRDLEKVRRAVVKAEECVGCGVCIARCKEGALVLTQGRIRVEANICTHCGECMEPCPAISFGDAAFDF
ncbi:MAG: phosphoadenosine phosphosulfate reductase family protein [Methanomassiliicoccales archaeon]|nr:phosphoadenosine phosphosulfate reductase family protein [Methanomassiliicoccales archaeon]